MTNDEIAKLARGYAEEQLESLKVYLGEQPEALKAANNISSQTTASSYVNFLNWLLRTHCIVSKEKVEEIKENRYLKEYEFLTERCFEDLNPENRDWHDISRLCDGIYYALKKLLDDTLTEE